MVMKHAEPISRQSMVCPSGEQEFPTFYSSNNIGERNMEQNNENPVIL